MSLRALGETASAGQLPDDGSDVAERALGVLGAADEVARRTREEAEEEMRRLIGEAREEAERVRAEGRGDGLQLQRATKELRVERQRSLDAVDALRDQLSSLLETDQARIQQPDG